MLSSYNKNLFLSRTKDRRPGSQWRSRSNTDKFVVKTDGRDQAGTEDGTGQEDERVENLSIFYRPAEYDQETNGKKSERTN